MKILGLSDIEVPAVYCQYITERFNDIDLVVSCGDLSAAYLEFVVSMLDLPLYYVQGNHVARLEDHSGNLQTDPTGAINLHKKVFYDRENDLILAGIEGSLRYKPGPYQYSQIQMWLMVFSLIPRLIWNKRYLK